MKTIKKQIKPIVLLLVLLILLQSCVAYKQSTLNQAVKTEKKARVQTKSGEILKFQRIGFEDGEFYGFKKVNGEIVKTQLNTFGIKKVTLHDKTLSTVLTIAIPIVIIGGALGIIQPGGIKK